MYIRYVSKFPNADVYPNPWMKTIAGCMPMCASMHQAGRQKQTHDLYCYVLHCHLESMTGFKTFTCWPYDFCTNCKTTHDSRFANQMETSFWTSIGIPTLIWIWGWWRRNDGLAEITSSTANLSSSSSKFGLYLHDTTSHSLIHTALCFRTHSDGHHNLYRPWQCHDLPWYYDVEGMNGLHLPMLHRESAQFVINQLKKKLCKPRVANLSSMLHVCPAVVYRY